ncbi:hypothetical protein ACNOYE_17875 [Nannocystaceae bacterium ST9]
MADPKDAHDPTERSVREGSADGKEREDAKEADPDERSRAFRRFGDSLLGNLLGDSGAAIRRGQGLVSGVAQGTKEELVRMISAEVRGFLDKMDAADLVQEIVSGLVIEMKTEIRFRRAEDGKLEPQIDNEVRHHEPDKSSRPDKPERGEKPSRPEKSDKPGRSEKPDKGE